jgi:TonB family protein
MEPMARASVSLLLWIPMLALADGRVLKPVDLTMSWTVSLDATGAITSLQPAEQTNQGLYERLEPGVRKWHFTPGKVNGKPAPSETTLTVHIKLEPVDSNYRVRVRDAGTGARYATMTPPKYPDGATVSRRGGAVMLEVHYDDAGKVTAAKPVEGGLPKPGSDIERAAVVAVKKWTFTPEKIGGHGLAGAVRVPLCFSAQPDGANHCHWQIGDEQVELDTKSPLAMNSIVHLKTEVAEQEL